MRQVVTSLRESAVQDTVTLIHNGTRARIDLPVLSGSEGPGAIDIRSLHQQLGLFTYDPGFLATASCRSAITYIDGDRGVLLHRGYPIEQLAAQSSYLELAWLLQHGRLPDQAQLEAYCASLQEEADLPEPVRQVFAGFARDAHPMAMMIAGLAALAGRYHDELHPRNPEDRDRFARLLLAKMPAMAAACHRHARGEAVPAPQDDLGYVEGFLQLMFGPRAPSPVAARALELIMILHADHEQNASTSTVRLAASSGTDPFASIAAGIASLWGPAHGGANEAVIRMLQSVESVDEVPRLVQRAKDRRDDFRLVGFGHRVYKNYDPRARVIRTVCHELLDALGVGADPLLDIACALEKTALEDEYFRERRLYPNVDFYSGIILRALGIPLSMFTVIFVMGRTAGWVAQWIEMMEDPELRIGRPRQLYVGAAQRDYLSVVEGTGS